MKRTVKPAKVEYTCDITGKDLSKESHLDPSHLELCFLTRLKKKDAREFFPKSEYPDMDDQDKLDYEWEYFNIDVCCEEAYNIYKLLKNKYPDLFKISESRMIVSPND